MTDRPVPDAGQGPGRGRFPEPDERSAVGSRVPGEQSSRYTLTLPPHPRQGVDIVKTIRYATGLGLMESKRLYDSACGGPVDLPLDPHDPEQWCDQLRALGCTVTGGASSVPDPRDAELSALRGRVAELERELASAIERANASDHLRPEYQADALEQKRLRIAAERERDEAEKRVKRWLPIIAAAARVESEHALAYDVAKQEPVCGVSCMLPLAEAIDGLTEEDDAILKALSPSAPKCGRCGEPKVPIVDGVPHICTRLPSEPCARCGGSGNDPGSSTSEEGCQPCPSCAKEPGSTPDEQSGSRTIPEPAHRRSPVPGGVEGRTEEQ